MSKTKQTITPEAAQATGAKTTEQTTSSRFASQLEAAKNAAAFMSSFTESDEDFLPTELRWKDDSFKESFRTRYFRHDEIRKLRRQIEREQFVQVTQNGAILDIPFTDIFEEDQFDQDDGTISRGEVRDKEKGGTIKECYLFLQPIGAYEALMRRRAQSSGDYVNPRKQAIEAQKRINEHADAGGVKSRSAVRTIEADLGSEDSQDGWKDLER